MKRHAARVYACSNLMDHPSDWVFRFTIGHFQQFNRLVVGTKVGFDFYEFKKCFEFSNFKVFKVPEIFGNVRMST